MFYQLLKKNFPKIPFVRICFFFSYYVETKIFILTKIVKASRDNNRYNFGMRIKINGFSHRVPVKESGIFNPSTLRY